MSKIVNVDGYTVISHDDVLVTISKPNERTQWECLRILPDPIDDLGFQFDIFVQELGLPVPYSYDQEPPGYPTVLKWQKETVIENRYPEVQRMRVPLAVMLAVHEAFQAVKRPRPATK
jgi:hypothetical protein